MSRGYQILRATYLDCEARCEFDSDFQAEHSRQYVRRGHVLGIGSREQECGDRNCANSQRRAPIYSSWPRLFHARLVYTHRKALFGIIGIPLRERNPETLAAQDRGTFLRVVASRSFTQPPAVQTL
jgi:hypothetical protein